MSCEITQVLLHGLIDAELNVAHVRAVELHVARCRRCGVHLRDYRMMRRAIRRQAPRYAAPEHLRRRLAGAESMPVIVAPRDRPAARNGMLRAFRIGSFISMVLATCVVLAVMHNEKDQRFVGDAVSAHLRSLHGQLIDTQSTDQHTVKPWFNRRINLAPSAIDLEAQGFTIVGSRLDYIDGHPVAAIVYEHHDHMINLFVWRMTGAGGSPTIEKLQDFNVWRWGWADLGFSAVSDLDAEELVDFGEKLQTALEGERS
jgi:anti-sigma factor RsiW